MCWKGGFSIKWLANFSSSMAISQYLFKKKCLQKSLQNGFSFLTERFVLVPKNYDVFNKKWQSLLKPTIYYRMASPDPIFFHRMEASTRVDPSRSVEEMARGMSRYQNNNLALSKMSGKLPLSKNKEIHGLSREISTWTMHNHWHPNSDRNSEIPRV